MIAARLYILLLTLAISTIFLFMPVGGEVGFLLNDKVKLQIDTYVWLLCDKIVVVGIVYVLYLVEPRYRQSMAVFLAIQIVDTVCWILNYSDPFKPLTFNILKIVIFLVAIINERAPLWKTKGKN